MFVQRLADPSSASLATFNSYGERIDARLKNTTEEGEPILDTFGEVQQIWHPWRRKYDLFLRLVFCDSPHFDDTYSMLI